MMDSRRHTVGGLAKGGLRPWFGRCWGLTLALVAALLASNIMLLHRVSMKHNARLLQGMVLAGNEAAAVGQKECPEAECAKCPEGQVALPAANQCPVCEGATASNRPSLSRTPPRFILSRIVGNNLPPLQSPGQLYLNVKYILEHEAPFEDCEKRWVLIYMANATERGAFFDLFNEHGYSQEQIVVKRINRTALAGLNETNWPQYEMRVIALNEGRNTALRDGFAAGARWVLPLDASQFLTREAWRGLVETAAGAEARGYKYIKMPMFRLQREQDPAWLNAATNRHGVLKYAPFKGESQLIFRNDATRWFDDAAVFGYRDKLQVLYDVCGRLRSKGNCGCGDAYEELLEGMPGWNRTIPHYPRIMKRCGYGVRLWPYPCNEPNLEETIQSIDMRPLVRIEGRQRLMYYVMGKLTTFEEMCGRSKFTVEPHQVIRHHNKLVLCKPWGDIDCEVVHKRQKQKGG